MGKQGEPNSKSLRIARSAMERNNNIKLTSAEISALFQNYLNDTMSICVFQYMKEIIQDQEIKKVIEHALDVSHQHVEIIRSIFKAESLPIPLGFTEQDVNHKAERLFSDTFCLYYLKYMTKGGLSNYGLILPQFFREDILAFYNKSLTSTMEINKESTELLLEKGLAVRPPYIPYPQQIEFVRKQSFLKGFLGEKRPLTGIEITQLYSNIQTNMLGESLAIAFSQVTENKNVRNYFLRGKEIAEKHIGIFSSFLREENLPVPMTWDHEITVKQAAPFSDKLMMYHFGLMNYSGIGNYGMAISSCLRRDLVASFSGLTAEIMKYAEDGLNILIDEEWLEQPPLAADRDDLAMN